MATTDFTNGVTLSDAGWADDIDCAGYAMLTGVGGTANAITATGPATYSLSATRPPVWFIAASTNTAATTITITPSGGAALTTKNVFSGNAACVGGEIVAGGLYGLAYDGTQFQLVRGGQSGNWTPSLGGSATYTTQSGKYFRIGRLVYIDCQLIVNSIGTGSTSTISGLPFTAGGIGVSCGAASYFSTLATNMLYVNVFASGTTVRNSGNNAAAATMTVDNAIYGNGSRIDFSFAYIVGG